MRILYLLLTVLIFCAQSVSATVHLPPFQYTPHSVAVIKSNIHQANENNPFKYITTGVFFKKGDVKNINSLSATNLKTELPFQIKPHNYYDDGSLRFAIITIYAEGDQKKQDIHLINKPSQSGKMPNLQFVQPLNIQVHVTTTQGQKHIFDLKKAKSEPKAWDEGPLLHQKRFHSELWQGMNIDFDIAQYHTGQYRADVVFHYDRLKKTPMQDIAYHAEIYVNGKVFKKIDQMTHHHHTRFRYSIYFGFKQENISLIDIDRAMAVGAFPRLDLSMGTALYGIERDYAKTEEKSKNLYDSGLLAYAMPTTGGRPEIGPLPQWASRYLVSGHDMARHVVLKHAELAAQIPWNYFDSQTKRPANPYDHPKTWVDGRATLQKNNITPYKRTSKWIIDTAHQPSLTYLPFIITGDRYHYDTMKSVYMNNRFRLPPNWPEKNIRHRRQSYEQIRSYGWFRRAAGEMHSILDIKGDPDAAYIQQANQHDLDYLYNNLLHYKNFGARKGKQYIHGQNKNIMGELTGLLDGYGHSYTTGRASNFMQDLAALGIGFEAGLGLQPWLKQFAMWQSKFIAGRFLQKHNGFPPEYGSNMLFVQFIPDKTGHRTIGGAYVSIMNKWRDSFKASIDSGHFNNARKEVERKGLAGYPGAAASFAAYTRASNAQLFNVTRNVDNLEAFGFLAQHVHMAMKEYALKPSYLIAPLFDDGVPLSYKNIEVGSDGSNRINASPYSLVHAGKGDDMITLAQPRSKAFIFGGEGNDILNSASGSGAYLFGGDGNDVLIASSGNDTLKGDEYFGKGKDVFVFPHSKIGQNVIRDFDPALDIIKLCAISTGFNIQNFVTATKNGTAMINLSGQNIPNSSGVIYLKNIRKNQLQPHHIQIGQKCDY